MKRSTQILRVVLPVVLLALLASLFVGCACYPPGTMPPKCQEWFDKGRMEGWEIGKQEGKALGFQEGYAKGLEEGKKLVPPCPTCPECPRQQVQQPYYPYSPYYPYYQYYYPYPYWWR